VINPWCIFRGSVCLQFGR